MFRGYRYRLDPTPEQESTFVQWVGVCRLIYNAALEQRDTFWRQCIENTGKGISFASQCRELTLLRAEFDWIGSGLATAQSQALRDLDGAFSRFFRGISKYPTPRRKWVNDSFRFKGSETQTRRLNAKWSAILIPKIGWVKYRDTRAMLGTIRTVTICRGPDGDWFACLSCMIETEPPVASLLPSVGVDRGVANTLTLSTGEHLSVPSRLIALERRQRIARHRLAKKKRGSVRYARQRRRVAILGSRGARIRADWRQRVTLGLAMRFGTVVLESLKVKNMTASGRGKRGLNRSILNQGWGAFETTLAYKLEERGGVLVKVPAAYTSQTCSCCGTIDRESRESQASFVCRHCGFAAHADVNAAINILRGSTPSMRVEAGESPADETRTRSGHLLVENHSALAA